MQFIVVVLAVAAGIYLNDLRKDYFGGKENKGASVFNLDELISDSVDIDWNLSVRIKRNNQLDSLVLLISQGKVYGFENDIYYFARCISNTIQFTSKRNVSNYSGVKLKAPLLDSLNTYDRTCFALNHSQQKEVVQLNMITPFLSKIFNPYEFEKMVKADGTVIKPYWNPFYRSTDMDLMKDFAFYLHQYKSTLKQSIVYLTRLQRLARFLIDSGR